MAPKRSAPAGYYAVKVGREVGVYTTWAECQSQVKGFVGAQYKKFASEAEAHSFVTGIAVATPSTASGSSVDSAQKVKKRGASSMLGAIDDESEWTVVYSDGACKGNGQLGSVAGIGVWWGPDDPRNVAERCPGDQTNNRAELIAILRILEETPINKEPLLIKTDSSYSIRCFQEWLPNWIKNGWVNSKNEPVKNAGIIRLISAHLDRRAQQGQRIQLSWVKGHSGHTGNDGADAEANKGTLLPPVPERDWEAAEIELRNGIATYEKPTASTSVIEIRESSEESSITIDPTPVLEPPATKRPRLKSPPPTFEGSSSAQSVAQTMPMEGNRKQPQSPKSPTRQSDRLAAIRNAFLPSNAAPDSSSTPQQIESSSKHSSGSMAKQNQDSLVLPPITETSTAPGHSEPPQMSNRLMSIKKVLEQIPEAPTRRSKSPTAAPSTSKGIRQLLTSSTTSPAKHSRIPTSTLGFSTATDTKYEYNQPFPPVAAEGAPSMAQFKGPASPMRVLYVSPSLLPVKVQDVDVNDYADCLLSDDELAKELED